MEVFWTAVRTAPGPSVVADPRSALRAMIRACERTRDVHAAPGRRLLVLRSAEPMLVLGDNSVALRRKDGTFGLTPPLLPEAVEVFAPLSPTCLFISTTRAHYRPQQGLTRRIAAKANAGAAAWCQDAVYRPPSMPWPSRLQLPGAPLVIRQPRLTAAPTPAAAQPRAGPSRDAPQRAAQPPGPVHPHARRSAAGPGTAPRVEGDLRGLKNIHVRSCAKPPGGGTGLVRMAKIHSAAGRAGTPRPCR